ncbi:MAG TPA: STAS domain-containing protein [Spirochaetales bacterium]|nr:STAS domain-containing protein [Spirochaetales bacterium]HRY55746.1 STAS domain-containing protein [Spirochaetia bacterium]HRZ65150.1 STAS domain-containing protein [Spirochaetia bacterium]
MTQLDIDVRREGGADLILVSGPVNSYTFSEFQEKVYKSVLSSDTIVDMSKVSTLSSAGIGVLMAALDEAEAAGHRLAICRPSEIVSLALESTGFQERFPVIASPKDF